MEEGNPNLGHEIRRRRQALRLTQEELGERCGLHPSYIGQMERGIRQPSLKTLHKIARALNIEPHAFFETSKKKSEPLQNLLDVLAVATPEEISLVTDIAKVIVGRQRKNAFEESKQ